MYKLEDVSSALIYPRACQTVCNVVCCFALLTQSETTSYILGLPCFLLLLVEEEMKNPISISHLTSTLDICSPVTLLCKM